VKIILDLQYQHMLQLPLTIEDMNRLPGSSWVNILHEMLATLNHELYLSADINTKQDIRGALLISEMFTEYTGQLIKRGAIPFLVFSQESPNISKTFYNSYAEKYNFRNAYLFPGSFNFFGSLPTNINLFWPNSTISLPISPVHKDIFIGMIASNKQIFNKRFAFLPTKAEQLIKGFIWKKYYQKLDKVGYIDLYEMRLQAIEYFSTFRDFSLYGRGWNNMNTLSKSLFDKIQKIGAVEIVSKMETLGRMKFSVCFENFKFPGYITEKIFDCFLAGSIPIYLGAPDISDYVPVNAFIDMRKFSSFDDVNAYIRSLTEDQIVALRDAGQQFLNSSDYKKFTDEAFSENILHLILTSETSLTSKAE